MTAAGAGGRTSTIRQECAPLDATLGRYPVLYVDPPWRYRSGTTDETRVIENHYPTMTMEELKALPVADIAHDDAVLFLWTTSPMLPEAIDLLRAWGFSYRETLVWVKPQMGMGYYFRQQHELLLAATRGAMSVAPDDTRPASVIIHDRLDHSRKPSVFRDIIKRMYPDLPGIELFARERSAGWTVWGNETDRGDAV